MIRVHILLTVGTMLIPLAPLQAQQQPPSTQPAPTLHAAIDAVYAGDHVQAATILTDILPDHREDPNYFLTHALSRLVAGRDRTATVALRTAQRFRRHSPETNAILALLYRQLGDEKQAHEHMQLATRHLAGQPLFELATATDLLMQRQWSKAAATLKTLAEADSPAAAEAHRRYAALVAFIDDYTRLDRQLQDAAVQLAAQEEAIRTTGAVKVDEKKRAETERENLKSRYDAKRAVAYQAYRSQLKLIQQTYNNTVQAASELDPENRKRAEQTARRWRDNALLKARKVLKEDYAAIDEEFAPAVKANTRKLNQLDEDIATLKQSFQDLQPKQEKLQRQQRELQDRQPFDVDAYWRTVALWLARTPLERSDLPGPPPAEAEAETTHTAEAKSEATASEKESSPAVHSRIRKPDEESDP